MSPRFLNLIAVSVICSAWLTGPGTGLAQTCPPATGDRSEIGEWDPVLDWPLKAIHMILLKNGKVLCVDDRSGNSQPVAIYNPIDNTFAAIAFPIDPDTGFPIDLFCSGHSQLADGRIVFVGGDFDYSRSHAHTVIFDPDVPLSDPWTVMADMPKVLDPDTGQELAGKRWYPTCTTLGDGRVLVLGGDLAGSYTHTADTPLIFDPFVGSKGKYTQLQLLGATCASDDDCVGLPGNCNVSAGFCDEAFQHLPYYPFVFQLSNQKVFYAGVGHEQLAPETAQSLDTALQTWTDVRHGELPLNSKA